MPDPVAREIDLGASRQHAALLDRVADRRARRHAHCVAVPCSGCRVDDLDLQHHATSTARRRGARMRRRKCWRCGRRPGPTIAVEQRARELVGKRRARPCSPRSASARKRHSPVEARNGPRTSAISIRSPGRLRFSVVNACRTPRKSTWIVATARRGSLDSTPRRRCTRAGTAGRTRCPPPARTSAARCRGRSPGVRR